MRIQELYQIFLQFPTICTDTRTISKDSLFFALKGENFNANTFADEALKLGAAYVIIDEVEYNNSDKHLLVSDVLKTLQDLATYHRQQLNIPVIGLTGSNGKTTTKELIKAVLAEQFQVFATKGNLNNHIGVPLSILSIHPAIEIAVIEMGANHQKEIEFLCHIAQPTHGLITNVGLAHLEGFGGFEGVKKGKGELYDYLANHQGCIFVNAANTNLMEMAGKVKAKQIIYYNNKHRNMVSGNLLQTDPLIDFEWSFAGQNHKSHANLTGVYNFENILAAISIGCFFNISSEKINHGLANYYPTNNRSQLSKTERNTVICDFYNANPSSMNAAINNLHKLSANSKIAILGDMFELGKESAEQHQKIIELALAQHFNITIFIGHHFNEFSKKYDALFFESREDAQTYLAQQNWTDTLILLKGSRGMALEKLLPLL